MTADYSPVTLHRELRTIGFPTGNDISSEEVKTFFEVRGINYEYDNHDLSIPCPSIDTNRVKEIIQAYRLFEDESIIRVALDAKGNVLCIARLGQFKGP